MEREQWQKYKNKEWKKRVKDGYGGKGRGVRKEGKEEIGKRRNVVNKTERGGETDIGE